MPAKGREQKHIQAGAKLAEHAFSLSADPRHHLMQKSSELLHSPDQLDPSRDEDSSVESN